MNPLKMEVLYIGHKGLGLGIQLPAFDGVPLVSLAKVGSFKLILHVSLSVETQATMTAKSAFFHLRLVRQLVPYLDSQDLAYNDPIGWFI